MGSICVELPALFLVSQMSAVGITENAKGDNKKFEIWCNSREEVFIVQVRELHVLFGYHSRPVFWWRRNRPVMISLIQASTPEIKTTWVNEIRKVLTQQLKAYRGTNEAGRLSFVFCTDGLFVTVVNCSFRCQSAEELWLCFCESHQQQHVHLPQVSGSAQRLHRLLTHV